MIVAVTDAGGRMLWVEGDSPAAQSRAAGMHFVEGARWAEDVAGTNAPGTALAVDHAVQIYGSEHFRRPVQPWSCSAAPVHDPVTGAAARRHRRDRRRPRRQPARAHAGARHRRGGRVGAALAAPRAAAARHGRRPPPLQRLAPRLEVLGRERARLTLPVGPARAVAAALRAAAAARRGRRRRRGPHAPPSSPPSATPATPRRSPSGPSCPGCAGWSAPTSSGSRPYRLLGRIDTDLDQVRRLLARGAVGAALERYPGAVLPGSQAPGVAVARERVSAPAPPGGAAQPPSGAAAPLRPAARGPGRRRRLAGLPGVAAGRARRAARPRPPTCCGCDARHAALTRRAAGMRRRRRALGTSVSELPAVTAVRPRPRRRAPCRVVVAVVALAARRLRDRHHRVRHDGRAARHRRRRRRRHPLGRPRHLRLRARRRRRRAGHRGAGRPAAPAGRCSSA